MWLMRPPLCFAPLWQGIGKISAVHLTRFFLIFCITSGRKKYSKQVTIMCILRRNALFESYRGPNFDKYTRSRWKENQTYYCYPSFDSEFRLRKIIVAAEVRFELLNSVKNTPLRSSSGSLVSFSLAFIHPIGHKVYFYLVRGNKSKYYFTFILNTCIWVIL